MKDQFKSIWPWVCLAMGLVIIWMYFGAMETRAEKTKAAQAENAQHAEAARRIAASGPSVVTHRTTEGDVMELAIPSQYKDSGILSTRRCVVWRDTVTQTTAIHCSPDDELSVAK